MDRPRLIALDLDGTLLDEQQRISPRARSAIERGRAAGAHVVLCTGRPPRMTHDFAADLGLEDSIVFNGASRYRTSRGDCVHHHRLDAEEAQAVVARLRTRVRGVHLGLETGDRWFLDPKLHAVARERLAAAGLPGPDGVGRIEQFLGGGAIKVFARHARKTVGELAACLEGLEVYATWSGPALLEVMHPAVNKRDALERLAAEHDLPRERVAAFGDNHNDVEMLLWAGHGVATANASEEALEAADDVTASNDEDGVARVLERWFG